MPLLLLQCHTHCTILIVTMPLVDSDIVSLLADLLPRAIVTISIVTMPLFESGIVSKLADPLLMVQ